MPKLIVTSRYLKSGSGKNLSNYVKYIATREGSVTVKENNGTAPATQKQQELILFLLKEFPESTEPLSMMTIKIVPHRKMLPYLFRKCLNVMLIESQTEKIM